MCVHTNTGAHARVCAPTRTHMNTQEHTHIRTHTRTHACLSPNIPWCHTLVISDSEVHGSLSFVTQEVSSQPRLHGLIKRKGSVLPKFRHFLHFMLNSSLHWQQLSFTISPNQKLLPLLCNSRNIHSVATTLRFNSELAKGLTMEMHLFLCWTLHRDEWVDNKNLELRYHCL